MRKVSYLWLILLPAAAGLAQSSAPPTRGVARGGLPSSNVRANSRAGFGRRAGPFAYPFFFDDYDSGYFGYPSVPNMMMVPPQPPPAVVVLPVVQAEPARLEIHEYGFEPTSPSSAEKSAAFVIVLKDGSTRSAVAVTVQNEVVHLVEADGRHQRVALESVDREATERRNRELNLQLQLPAPER